MFKALEILLVEDSATDRFLAIEALSEVSTINHVHAVEDGVEALDFLRHQGKYSETLTPDLILLDLNLPRKDGRMVLSELKADPTLCKIPVIILASPGDISVQRAYPEHAQSYITKPIDHHQFNEVIRIFKDLWFPDDISPSALEADVVESRSTSANAFEASQASPNEEEENSLKLSVLPSMLGLGSNECLVISDTQRNTLWANEAFTRMCGYNLQELLGRNIGSLLQGPKTDRGAQTRMSIAVKGGRSCTEEILNYHKDGYPYWVRLTINPICGPDGAMHGFLAIEYRLSKTEI
jgi:two-component system, chemotaxis family, response regulator Rcp1